MLIKTLHIDIPDDLQEVLNGDSMRFKQILLNLLGNATQITEKGSISIPVAHVFSFDTSLTLRFSVTDTGIGMSPEVMERIFLPFEQADTSTTRRYGGTGLGLPICCRLAKLMGGRIWAESTYSKGSTFFVELPFMIHSRFSKLQLAPELEPEPAAQTSSLKILVAEDNLINGRSIMAILKRLGHQVGLFEDGQKAFDAWQNHYWDCVLMDIQMPVLDGIAAMQMIRREEKGTGLRTPIIALTAHALQGDRERLLAEGFDGYLAKPVEIAELTRELHQIN